MIVSVKKSVSNSRLAQKKKTIYFLLNIKEKKLKLKYMYMYYSVYA
jgi:hypothetical protein